MTIIHERVEKAAEEFNSKSLLRSDIHPWRSFDFGFKEGAGFILNEIEPLIKSLQALTNTSLGDLNLRSLQNQVDEVFKALEQWEAKNASIRERDKNV